MEVGDISKKNRSIDVRRTMQNHFFYKSRLPTPKVANQKKKLKLKKTLSIITKTINNSYAIHSHIQLIQLIILIKYFFKVKLKTIMEKA